jgi:hypothetical protein
MIKSFTAVTEEIDDIEYAVNEILQQLDLKKNLLKNSVGIISAFAEFIETGVYEAISKALPFDVIGSTTSNTLTNETISRMGLSLLVLTSDDVEFSSVRTENLLDNIPEAINKAYQKALKGLTKKPSNIFAYYPFLNIGGAIFTNEISRISNNVPIFGTVVSDISDTAASTNVFFKGGYYNKELAFLLIAGEANINYHIISLSNERIQKNKAIITNIEGNVLKEINDQVGLKYLNSFGICLNEKGFETVPLIVQKHGEEPVARAMYFFTKEGYIALGAPAELNSTIAIGSIDAHEVVKTAQQLISDLVINNPHTLLCYSCVGRFFSLGVDHNAEMEIVRKTLKDQNINIQLSYSNGEICPVHTIQNTLQNNIHNFTLVIAEFN